MLWMCGRGCVAWMAPQREGKAAVHPLLQAGTIEREVDEWNIDFFFFQSPKFSPNSKGVLMVELDPARVEQQQVFEYDRVGAVPVTTSSWPYEVHAAEV